MKKEKTICILATVDITLNAFVLPTIESLQRAGFSVTLVASMSRKFIEKNSTKCKLINIGMERGVRPIGMIRSIWTLYRLFRKEKFDIIQYATPNASLYASIASKIAGCHKRVYCQWGIRYVGLDGFSRKLFKSLEKITCNLSTHIRPASQKNLEFAVSEGLYKASKAKIIGNGGTVGIDLKEFNVKNKEINKERMIALYPHLSRKIVFGFVGRLDKDKGVNELFEAFLKINEHFEDAALIVLGNFDKPAGINKDLLNRVEKLDNVIFTGHVNDVPKYISCFDVLVHPSYREGFSMVIQQAMAMKVAVITSDIAGPSEVIVAGESGITVDAKSSEQLSVAMQELISNPMKRGRFANSGYLRAKTLFYRERMVDLTVIDRNDIYNIKN